MDLHPYDTICHNKWLLVVILLMTITSYYINVYWLLLYYWLLVAIVLMAIGCYSINDYW
jgi:hypothetical protein